MHAKPQFEASVPLKGHILRSRAVGRALSFQLPPAPSPAIACELGAILASSLETQKFPEKALPPPPKKKERKESPKLLEVAAPPNTPPSNNDPPFIQQDPG